MHPIERSLIKEIARLFSSGQSLPSIARAPGIQIALSDVEKLMETEFFVEVLKEADPAALNRFQETKIRDDDSVKLAARRDSVDHYEALKKLVRDGDLSDKDKASFHLDMIKLGMEKGELDARRTIHLSKEQLKGIEGIWDEATQMTSLLAEKPLSGEKSGEGAKSGPKDSTTSPSKSSVLTN